MIYLTNSLGELTGNADVPENVLSWYQTLYTDRDALCYLVLETPTPPILNFYGAFALFELDHPKCESWEENKDIYLPFRGKADDEIEGIIDEIMKKAPPSIGIDKNIGFQGRHEVNIFSSVTKTPQEFNERVKLLEDFWKIHFLGWQIIF